MINLRQLPTLLPVTVALLSPIAAQESEPESRPAMVSPTPVATVEVDHRGAFQRIRGDLVALVASLDNQREAMTHLRSIRNVFNSNIQPEPINEHERVLLILARFAAFGVLEEEEEEILISSDEDELLIAEVLAAVSYAAGNSADAHVFSRQAIALGTESVAILDSYRAELQQQNDHEGMPELTELLIKQQPNNPQHHYYRAIAQIGLRDHEGALESMKTSLDLEPTSVAALNGYARCLSILGRHEEAIPSLDQLVLIHPDGLAPRENLIIALSAMESDRTEDEVTKILRDYERFEWNTIAFRRAEFSLPGHEVRALQSFTYDTPYAFAYIFEYRDLQGRPVLRYLHATYAEEGHAPTELEDGTTTPRRFLRLAYTPDGLQHRYGTYEGEAAPFAQALAEARAFIKEDGTVDLQTPEESLPSPK